MAHIQYYEYKNKKTANARRKNNLTSVCIYCYLKFNSGATETNKYTYLTFEDIKYTSGNILILINKAGLKVKKNMNLPSL